MPTLPIPVFGRNARIGDIRPLPGARYDRRHGPATGTSLELSGDLVQAGLDAGLVGARRAGEANAADKIIASLDW